MFTKQILASFTVTCVLTVLICSCSDNSTVGAQWEENKRTDAITSKRGTRGLSISSSRVYVFALDERERSIAVRIYDSITDLDFPLSPYQIEMISAGEIIEITRPDMVSGIVCSTFGFLLQPERGTISAIGIIYTDTDILGASWSCLKECAGAADRAECLRRCEKEKSDGRSIYIIN